MWVRLCGLLLLLSPVALFPLMMRFPGRSVNTGMPDSGIFGWVGAALMTAGLVLLIGGKAVFDAPKEPEVPPKEEEKK